jgi:hypothetical protein
VGVAPRRLFAVNHHPQPNKGAVMIEITLTKPEDIKGYLSNMAALIAKAQLAEYGHYQCKVDGVTHKFTISA